MELVVVSGLSGAGKSVAMAALEDLGYDCVDNLPFQLFNAFVDQLQEASTSAVSLDARNLRGVASHVPQHIDELRSRGVIREVFFLEADDEVLLKRFSETRRRHPLTEGDNTLAEALALERTMLAGVRGRSDTIIDTTRITLHQLGDLIRVLYPLPGRKPGRRTISEAC